MASTDTRSGFRLPWSSDRSQDDAAFRAGDGPEPETEAAKRSVAWPESDLASRAAVQSSQPQPDDAAEEPGEAPTATADETDDAAEQPDDAPTATADDAAEQPGDAPTATADDAAEEPGEAPTATADETDDAEQPEPVAARSKKPTKLMADLATAIRATTETARDQRLGQLDSEANGIIETIRAQSEEGAVALRRKSDEDVAAIRDWSKAEIARIKEESESKIADRKHLLEQEVADHAAAIEDRCAEVQSAVAGYREAMDAYFEHLDAEQDPARLATMAEAMPEPPTLEGFSDLDDLPVEGAAARHAAAEEALAEAEAQDAVAALDTAEAEAEAEIEADVDAEAAADGSDDADEGEIVVSEDRIASALGYGDDAPGVDEAEGETEVLEDDAEAVQGEAEEAPSEAGAEEALGAGPDDVPRWAAGDVPEGFPSSDEGGDPVDRGSIMAALEAAAEAVVAAESAAESADTAEAAADVAETAAELFAHRSSPREEADPEAEAAMSARVDAGGFETESYQDRLASLLPGHAEIGADAEPRTTQVVVTGLVSVASIASFKRHLGRLSGVTAVAVASGPDGEFIFNATHRADVSFRDVIPTLPGFAARVVASGDGVVNVTAHDPEAEG